MNGPTFLCLPILNCFGGRHSRKLSYTLSCCSLLLHTRSQSDRFGPDCGLTMRSPAVPTWACLRETQSRARRGLPVLAALSITLWNSVGTPGLTPLDPRGHSAQRPCIPSRASQPARSQRSTRPRLRPVHADPQSRPCPSRIPNARIDPRPLRWSDWDCF